MCVIDTLTGSVYHCWSAHNSTDDNQPGYGSGWRTYWFIRWASGVAYRSTAPALLSDPDTTVVHNKTVYQCILNVPASLLMEPGVTSGWATYWTATSAWSSGLTTNILQPGETLGSQFPDPWLWAPSMDFTRSDTIFRQGILYRCLQNHNSGTDSAGSNPLEPGIGVARRPYWATEWQPATHYINGDAVTCKGPLYICYANHTSGLTNEPAIGQNCQTYWYWSPIKPGSSAEDFYNAFILINNQAEINWGLNADVPPGDPSYQLNPGYQNNWYDLWNATPAALAALAARMDSWFANPLMKVKVSNLPPTFYQYQLGAMVGVSGLMLPSAGAVWGTPCYRKQFMIMNNTLDSKKCTVSFDLMEIPPPTVLVTPEDGALLITWGPGIFPATSQPLVRYDLSLSAVGISLATITGVASPWNLTGLGNGVIYDIVITAYYVEGSATFAMTGIPVAPPVVIVVPDAPTNVVASLVPGEPQQVAVSFTPSAAKGGLAIINYIVRSYLDGFLAEGTSSPIIVSGLAYATSYTFTVAAINSTTASVASVQSNSVTTPAAIISNPALAVTGLIPAVNNGFTILQKLELTIVGHNLPDGSTVIISGVASGVDGTHVVNVIDVNTVVVQGLNYLTGDMTWSGSGTVTLVD